MRGKWWLALLALIVCPIALALISQVMEKRYTASIRILAENRTKSYDQNGSPFAGIDDVTGASGPRSTDTVVQILTGSDVLVDAIQRTAQKFPKAFAGGMAADKYENLTRRLAIDSSPLTDVITIRVTLDNAEIAAETANQIGNAYLDYARRMESESGNSALVLIDTGLVKIKEQLDQIDQNVKTVKEQAQISDQTAASTYSSQAVFTQENRVAELEGLRNAAQAELTIAEESLRTTDKMVASASQVQANPTLITLESNKNALEGQLNALRIKYMDDADPVKEVQEQLRVVNQAIAKAKQMIDSQKTTALNPNWQQAQLNVINAKARIANLDKQSSEAVRQLDALKAKNGALPDVERRLNELIRERQVLESNYQQLQIRKQVISSTGSGRKNPARIVAYALVPSVPSFPDMRLFTLIGLAIGFIIAALIVMPRGDTDIYGQWPKSGRSKGLSAAKQQSMDSPTMPDSPAIGGSDGANPPDA